jgi:molecular chaperone DnaK
MAPTYLGIDLGTTNSVAVVSDGERGTAARTAEGGPLLPSVVRIDARGNVTVGARARRFLDSDPDNTRAEFKRLMGSGRKLSFRAAKLEKTPEELSAMVLGTLRSLAEQALGHAPAAAVVTVPALFELPQTRATSEAARLAGFERVEHLQEPVASAMTAGWKRQDDPAPWLVYDLGGGTFDVSLLETREGVLRVVDHDGDNFLGGRDMDGRLLDHVLERLREETGKTLSRSDPAAAGTLRRLRTACEEAKMELGAGRSTSVSLAEPLRIDGDEVVLDVGVEVAAFEDLVRPIVDRSADVCLRLLARQGVEPGQVGRIVLVGGPTVMPLLRNRLHERLGIALATDVDPMTAVAEGAALFASEHGLSTSTATGRAGAISATASGTAATAGQRTQPASKAWLQYPSVSGDLYPFVVGRVAQGSLKSVRVRRADGKFESAEEQVDGEGSFVVQVELLPRTASTFLLSGKDAGGADVALDPGSISIRHGLSLADPPLPRSIGIALADGGVAVYFEKGAPLPSRKSFRLRTSLTIHPGQSASALRVPIVQGETAIAHLCRLVGHIDIRPEDLREVLPAGSAVDVVLDLDRGGKLVASAFVPDRAVSFPGAVDLVSPETPLDDLVAQLAELRKRTEALYGNPLIDADGRRRLVAIDGEIDDAEREVDPARGGDGDALEKLRRLVIDIDASLADVGALLTWPELEKRASAVLEWATLFTARAGTDAERQALQEAVRSLDRARAVKNATEFDSRLRSIRTLAVASVMRDPHELTFQFEYATGRVAEMRDPRAAQQVIGEGQRALKARDFDGVRKATYELWGMLPPTEQERARAHGSGVER